MTCRDCDGAGCPECALPRRGSGAPSEAYYASRDYHQIKVRLPLATLAKWRRLAANACCSRSEWLARLIDRESG